ncbi:unnamed protein product [Nyctereutes procyonoides]|uniref:(raccoon dog) hypothetical protein n=1 Tax=Nyctereutes procyonoides TaxID=34880 RepID=A0A811XZI2_NYCPR|nr:unnamed protein product [Nyctereutes procyonoides]
MPLGKSSELWKQGEDLEEAQGLVDAQLSGAQEEEKEEEETPPPSSTSISPCTTYLISLCPPPPPPRLALPCPSLAWSFGPPEEGSAAPGALSAPQSSQSAEPSPSGGAAGDLGQPEPPGPSGPGEAGDEEPLVEGSFHMKMAALVMFLLLKYRNKQPTSKAEMLEVFTPEYQDDFPAILSQASICLRLVFGLDVIEVDPSEHSYVLNPILGLTWDGMLSDQWGLPKTGLLGLVLGLILLQDGCVPRRRCGRLWGHTGCTMAKNTSSMGSPGTSSPTSGCRKVTWSAGRWRAATLPAMSSCGGPGPPRKPASCRS